MVVPVLFSLFAFSLPPGLRPWPPPDPRTAALVKQARDGNRAAIAAIRTLECRFSHEVISEARPAADTPGNWLPCGQFWRDGSAARTAAFWQAPPREFTTFNGTEFATIRGNRYLAISYHHRGKGPPEMGLWTCEQDYFHIGNVWNFCLFTHYYSWSKKLEYLTLDEILKRPHEIWQAGWDTDDGRKLLRVELALPTARLGFWLDPSLNFLIRKAVFTMWETGFRREYHVRDVARSADGAVLPVRVDQFVFERGQLQHSIKMTLSGVTINQPLPHNILRIPQITGWPCTDWDRRVTYVADADGDPAGPEQPIPEARDPPPPPLVTAELNTPSPDAQSPRAKSKWIMILTAAGVTAGSVSYFRARRRARPAAIPQ